MHVILNYLGLFAIIVAKLTKPNGVDAYFSTYGACHFFYFLGEIPTLNVIKVLSLSPEQSPNWAAMNSATERISGISFPSVL